MREERIRVSNNALKFFAGDTQLVEQDGYIYVSWRSYRTNRICTKRWMTRGQDFYPVWFKSWPHGGTSSTALSQLVRWCQGKPVFSISTWKYWCSPTVMLGSDKGELLINELALGGYPDKMNCVLCGIELTGPLDWWSLNKVSGPCCSLFSKTGCRQKVKNEQEN